MMKSIRNFLSFFILTFCISGINGQTAPSGNLKYTWAGGLNSCQFCSIDLNLDGLNDLLIFDRHGNRKLTFINEGGPGINYRYAPEYEAQLPEMQEWVITADYNCDGKMDIFTYANGGVRVFRNTSSGSLSFHLQTNLLQSWYYTGFVGILVTSADYPAIADLDGDGDLDLLTFFGLGSYIEYHKNLSMETFGNCDSLDYRLTDHCWGKFMESVGGDHITLNSPCPYKDLNKLVSPPERSSPPKHMGSTLLATDLNGDGLSDLVTGGVYFSNLIELINGGTKDSAFMISQDTLFPSYDRSVSLNSFPVMSFLDLDNDGIKDLVVSPFDPAYYNTENTKSVWFYKNTGTNTNPHFVFQTDNLFQSDMLDFGTGSNPVAVDLNNDGLDDIVTGNYGYFDSSQLVNGFLTSYNTSSLAYLKNTGSSLSPGFELLTTDLAHASQLNVHGLYPAFYDLNNDGIPDLLCGCEDGSLIYFQGRGDSAGIPVYGSPQKNYQQIKTGQFSAPQFFDLDRDGLADLIIGQQNGTMQYFRNTGSAGNPKFTFTRDSLGQVDVTNHNLSYYGYCTPYFFRINNRTYLLAGSDEGKMHIYSKIDGNLNGKFNEIDSLNFLIGIPDDSLRIGWRASGFLAHLSDPQYYDMICGNFSGGLNYFTKGKIPGIEEHKTDESMMHIRIYPNPAMQEIKIDLMKNGISLPAYSSGGSGLCIISLFNVFGQEVKRMEYIPSQSVSISDLPDGIYIARIDLPSSNSKVRGKFLIKKTVQN